MTDVHVSPTLGTRFDGMYVLSQTELNLVVRLELVKQERVLQRDVTNLRRQVLRLQERARLAGVARRKAQYRASALKRRARYLGLCRAHGIHPRGANWSTHLGQIERDFSIHPNERPEPQKTLVGSRGPGQKESN